MLNIYYGDMEGAIYNTSVYFDNTYLNSWLDDKMAADIIRSIDEGEILSAYAVDTEALGVIPVTKISGGTKTLLLIRNDHTRVFNASTCGDNCAKWILEIAKATEDDITINLHHVMDFGSGEFDIRILNTGDIVHNMVDLLPIAVNALKDGVADEKHTSEEKRYTVAEAAKNMHEAYLKCKFAFEPRLSLINDQVSFDNEEEEFFYRTVSDFFIQRRQRDVTKHQSYGKKDGIFADVSVDEKEDSHWQTFLDGLNGFSDDFMEDGRYGNVKCENRRE